MTLSVRPVTVGPLTKGLRLREDRPAAEVLAERPALSSDVFAWPLLTLDEAALEHNIAVMAAVCAAGGVEHAPHVKTAMSAGVFERQMRAGAWGATVASPAQLRVVRSWGVPTVFLANELVDPREITWLRGDLEAARAAGQPAEVWVYVDSAEGLLLLERGFAGADQEVISDLGVLVELGVGGARTGVRGVRAAVELGRAAAATGLRLRGVAGYEGSVATGTSPADLAAVAQFCRDLREVTQELERGGLVRDVPIVSAGGSAYVDVVLAELPGPLADGAPVRAVVRSGAYVTYDHGLCDRADPWSRLPSPVAMRPAATVWCQVLSVPEPGLALCGAGRRDVPYDIDLPTVVSVRRMRADGSLSPSEPRSGLVVKRVDDQHCYVVPDCPGADGPGADVALRPGDVLGLGISHPCTVFDKWRVAVIVDAEDRAVDLVETDF